MKKIVLSLATLLVSVVAMAQVDFGFDAGVDLVSTYIWRGQYNGALSLQPSAAIGFDAAGEQVKFRVGAWGSVGSSDYLFRKGETYFVPEIDVFATLDIYGLKLGATHYYYFNHTPYFSGLNDDGGSQTEVQIGYDLSALTQIGLYFNWYTMVAGNDVNADGKRAYSSYAELGYRHELPLGMSLDVQVGMQPWSGLYTDYDGGWKNGFAITNIAMRYDKVWEFGPCELDLFAQLSLNPYNLDKSNYFIWAAGDNVMYQQKFNGVIGLGFWF